MPKKRPPKDVWSNIRMIVWMRDNKCCTHCHSAIPLNKCHIDHITSGKRGTNRLSNLRTLCRKCHVLRADNRHRGMIATALRDGIIPVDWRKHTWED
ncbi:MAG TPA: HNH endonuclease [Bacillota bacterium]|jgi:5-methylcytosine-specific restriction protein A|nr:HNH endonuclease [Bacillota bacterium]